jgi:hypothetical protein
MKADFKKKIVLGILFIFPIVVYLFFASGKNNFAKLPVLNSKVSELYSFKSIDNKDVYFKNKITILGYWGSNVDLMKTEALNLNQKIYKRFYEFKDFQFVIIIKKGMEDKINHLKNELREGVGTDLSGWNFLSGNDEDILKHFTSLMTPLKLDEDFSTPFVFIIDKESQLRGRNDDEDSGTLYGFDSSSVAEINKKMIDDVKVILVEYRLALKRYNIKKDK